MTTRTGIMDLTGSGKDLAEMYETRLSGPTGTTHYLSQIHGKDLGSIFYFNANLGGLGLTGAVGANCGHKLLNGTDLGSLFCLKGTVASAISSNTNIINNLISGVSPWGIYDASLWNSTTNVLPEARGNGLNVSSSGTITYSTGSGNGATASIPSIAGDATATLLWPLGSISNTFTICSITRWTDSTNTKGLLTNFATGSKPLFVLSHWDLNSKFAVYVNNMFLNDHTIVSGANVTNWFNVCARPNTPASGGTIASNVKFNSVNKGTQNAGTVSLTANDDITRLCINKQTNVASYYSKWALTYLVIYDTLLTDAQMNQISAKLDSYLATGSM